MALYICMFVILSADRLNKLCYQIISDFMSLSIAEVRDRNFFPGIVGNVNLSSFWFNYFVTFGRQV